MDQYMEAVQAAVTADKAKRWTQPVKVFGYIVIGLAAVITVLGLIGGLASLSNAPAQAVVGIAITVVAGTVLFLQGSVVLMLSLYVQMKCEQVSMEVSRMLENDEEE